MKFLLKEISAGHPELCFGVVPDALVLYYSFQQAEARRNLEPAHRKLSGERTG